MSMFTLRESMAAEWGIRLDSTAILLTFLSYCLVALESLGLDRELYDGERQRYLDGSTGVLIGYEEVSV